MGIKAIETHYDGYRFRSRLEARYAVMLDALGVKWEYEKEGYDINGVWYLPDFWLPERREWIEIKAVEPTPEEFQKMHDLCRMLKANGKIWFGDPQIDYGFLGVYYNGFKFDWHSTDDPGTKDWLAMGYSDDRQKLAQIEKDGGAIFVQNGPLPFRTFHDSPDDIFVAAIGCFRSARFEHGESG